MKASRPQNPDLSAGLDVRSGGCCVCSMSDPIQMTPERWRTTARYLAEVFGREDELLLELVREARASGLPEIAISAEVGRVLKLLASTTQGRTAIELGTLGGYSGIWILRGLAPEGRLITVEAEPRHADFAQRQFERAGLAARVEIRRGFALDVLPELTRQHGPGSIDFAFIDAVKTEYVDYWRSLRPLIAVGGLFVADNVLGAGNWWIDSEESPQRAAVDRFNRVVAADPDFEVAALPIREGVLVARRTR